MELNHGRETNKVWKPSRKTVLGTMDDRYRLISMVDSVADDVGDMIS